ncbi:hypothetical protein [Nocardioides nanhaiensis]|uniref:EfeO-type cupredoxin-like domain-containing protein n=1 Tax=Nocardioides nanhaiensis TaxID=1476871 RepID=A0ABP8WVQ6_9ACTN
MRTTRSSRSSRSSSTRSRRLAAPAAVAALVLALSACGSDDDTAGSATESSPSASASESASPTPSGSASESTSESAGETDTSEPAEPAGPSIDISVEGDQVTPNAETLEVEVGQPLTLNISSDRAGELHVHAKPEQYVDFEAGNTESELVIETPGSVEIEEHESGAVIALLTVR